MLLSPPYEESTEEHCQRENGYRSAKNGNSRETRDDFTRQCHGSLGAYRATKLNPSASYHIGVCMDKSMEK